MDFSDYKAFLFDVDKTLTNSNKEITQATKTALQLVASKGYSLGVCTGRSYSTLYAVLSDLFPEDSLHVVAGGAQVITSSGVVRWQQLIDKQIVYLIVDEAIRRQLNVVISSGKTLFTNVTAHSYSMIGQAQSETKNIDTLSDWNVPIVTVYHVDPDFYVFLDKLPEVSYKKMVSYSGHPYVDITPSGVTKARAVREWSTMRSLTLKEIIGFGDSENDVEFLQTVGYSVAMGNATKGVQSIANEVTDDCDHDGVATWIERNL